MKDWAGVNPETGKPQWYKNVYEQQQAKDAAGNLLWNPMYDENGKAMKDAEGNTIWDLNSPVKEDVWYDRYGNKYDSKAAADASNDPFKRRNAIDRETTETYSEADYYVINKTTVAPVFGGFGTSLKAYGFDFAINFTYQLGGKQYDNTYAQFMAPPTTSNAGYNFHKDVYDSWTPANPNASIPRWQFADQYSSSQSTRFLTDASYLNIQNINLGYTFPKNWTTKALINNLRVYVSAENVFYWSKRKGFDPRQQYGTDSNGNAGSNATRYAPIRTISAGISATF
jgi:hypothetical protein